MDKALMKTKTEQVLALQPDVRFAYLFGSQVKGTAGLLSDIDIAVFLMKQPMPRGIPMGPNMNWC